MPGKPLMYGEDLDTRARPEGTPMPGDIPGYAEIVKARDVAKAQYPVEGIRGGLTEDQKREYFKRFGTEPKDTEWEFKFGRVAGPNGSNSYEADREMMFYEDEGYELVKLDPNKGREQFREKFGYGFPRGAHIAPDGTVRRMDTALMKIKGDTHRRNEKARERERQRRLSDLAEDRTLKGHGGPPIDVEVTGRQSKEIRHSWNN